MLDLDEKREELERAAEKTRGEVSLVSGGFH